MIIGTALGSPNLGTIVLSVALAFVFGSSVLLAEAFDTDEPAHDNGRRRHARPLAR